MLAGYGYASRWVCQLLGGIFQKSPKSHHNVEKLHCGRPPTVKEVPPELIKTQNTIGLYCLTCSCTIMWRSGTVPQDWQTAMVVCLFKEDCRLCSNYRGGLSLLSLPDKVYAEVLERKLQLTEPQNQHKICSSYETLDQLYTLTRIHEGAWEYAQLIHMCLMGW